MSREEILLEEIRRFSKNKPMIIIGVILILLEWEYDFWEIDAVDLSDLLIGSGFSGITLSEVRRVMTKIENSDLLDELIPGNQIGLQKAYKLYR